MIATLEAEALLADGSPFHLGMTVFFPVGGIDGDGDIRRIATDPETHEVRRRIHDGILYNCLARKGGRDDNDTSFFYPSRESILDARIARLEREITDKTAALARMQSERKHGS